jgi:mannose-6-phosphate isomerase-like protein (cupin superfamily)
MHTENEEVYIILSGSGRYLDGGEYHDVGPGDVTLTSPEGPHALENTGTEPLVFVALFAEKES